MKLLDHGMKVVKRGLEKRLRRLLTLNEMLFGSMPEGGTVCNTSTLLQSRRLECSAMQRLSSYVTWEAASRRPRVTNRSERG